MGIIPPFPKELAHKPVTIPTLGSSWIFVKVISILSLRYFNVYGDRQPTEGAYCLVMGIFAGQRLNNKPTSTWPTILLNFFKSPSSSLKGESIISL